MLQRLIDITANIDIFGSTGGCFQSREVFNVHPMIKHHEQDPFPDQLKVGHFVIQRKFLALDVTRNKVEKFGDPKKACVSTSIDCYKAGKKKVMDNLESKKFSLFRIISERSNGTDDDESDSDEL